MTTSPKPASSLPRWGSLETPQTHGTQTNWPCYLMVWGDRGSWHCSSPADQRCFWSKSTKAENENSKIDDHQRLMYLLGLEAAWWMLEKWRPEMKQRASNDQICDRNSQVEVENDWISVATHGRGSGSEGRQIHSGGGEIEGSLLWRKVPHNHRRHWQKQHQRRRQWGADT